MKITGKIIAVVCAVLLFAGQSCVQPNGHPAAQPAGQQAAQPAKGKVYTVNDVPNVRLADGNSAVSNPDGTLSPATVAALDTKLIELQRQTSIEIAVVVISSIGNSSIEDFGIELFRQWGIGKAGRNNGLLMLLVTDDRLVRFEVGYGLEGELTDAMSKRIQTTRMMPYLLVSDWDGAVTAGVDAVVELFTDPGSELHKEAEADDNGEGSIWGIILFLFGGLAAIMGLAMLAQRRANKCPRCGAQMKVVGSETVKDSSGRNVTVTTLKCPKCGYTTTRESTHNPGGGSVIGGGMMGGMIGGMMGGGRGGGFGGGGSWGGGSAGGGGATTRF